MQQAPASVGGFAGGSNNAPRSSTNLNNLPPGWDVRRDQNNRTYFINHNSRSTTWTDPRPLPTGWEVRVDASSNRPYFIDHVNKKTCWVDPRPGIVFPEDIQRPTLTPVEIAEQGRTMQRRARGASQLMPDDELETEPTYTTPPGAVDVWYDNKIRSICVGKVGSRDLSDCTRIPANHITTIRLGKLTCAFNNSANGNNCFTFVTSDANAFYFETLTAETRGQFVEALRTINPNIEVVTRSRFTGATAGSGAPGTPATRNSAQRGTGAAAGNVVAGAGALSLAPPMPARPSAGSSTNASPRGSTGNVDALTTMVLNTSVTGDAKETDKVMYDRGDVYYEVLRLAVIDNLVSPDEEHMLHKLRQEWNISDEKHSEYLKKLGIEDSDYAEMHKDPMQLLKKCVFCLDEIADHVVVPCFHVCLCESDHAVHYKDKPNTTCPVCRDPIQSIHKLF